MTGFDPTAKPRDTEQDEDDLVEGNVVPPEDLRDPDPDPVRGAPQQTPQREPDR